MHDATCYPAHMRYIAMMLALLLAAAPLWAVKLKLKADAEEFEAAVLNFDGENVTYRRGRKELTAKLADFEHASAFEIKKQYTREDGAEWLELARFALHRALYTQAHDTARQAASLDPRLQPQVERVLNTARYLQADALLERGSVALDEQKIDDARRLLTQVIEQFPDTPAKVKAEILLGTLDRVALEIKAKELEEAARKAQEAADADERKKRKPTDDWLNELSAQVDAQRDVKRAGDTECVANRIHKGLPMYENVVKALETIRKQIEGNRHYYTFRGQMEQANSIDKAAKTLMVDTYERWVYYLYFNARYDVAAGVCNTALKLAPSDRRLLSLKVDIDNMYDPLQK